MREYVTVQNCPEYAGPHQHLLQDETVYCHAAGKWLRDLNSKTYKELKDAWFKKKPKEEETKE